jgi:Holliday junction resolvasome RuvABC endonuclease subunit
MQPITKILGLDLSLNHTGWCTFTVGEPASLQYGVHDLEKSPLSEIEKMDAVLIWLEPMLTAGAVVIIEGFAFAAKGRAVYQMAGLQYLVRHLLFQKAVPFKLVTPNQAKKFLTGKHNSDKNLILLKTFRVYGIEVEDDNIADAINMNKIGQAILGLLELSNQAQQEVVEELIKGKAPRKKRTQKPPKPRPDAI